MTGSLDMLTVLPGRGRLRIYVGSAAGVGKTYAMLGDGRTAAMDGSDVVIGYLEPHGRQRTEEQAAELEQAPVIDRSGRRAERELDVGWLLDRTPSVCLVDELAHSNAPGSAHKHRFEDVEQLLRSGIDVWTTVNIQHLESLNDHVERLTGVLVRETFPDRILHGADEIRLIDLSPDSLRERIAAGLVYPAEQARRALDGFFALENLAVLRAMALHELAENAQAQLARLRGGTGVKPAETLERVLVAIGGLASSAIRLIRAGERIARRSDAQLFVLFVDRAGGRQDDTTDATVERARDLTSTLAGVFLRRPADDPGDGIVAEVLAQEITTVVIGSSARSRWQTITGSSPVERLMREAPHVDVHVVGTDAVRPSTAG